MPIATIERLVLSVVVLAVPTIAMGGTLPAAARAVTRAKDVRRQHLAMLYAVNTLGAVAGCLVATFFLLEMFGTRATLWLAAAVNLLVAMIARSLDRRWAREPTPATELTELLTPADALATGNGPSPLVHGRHRANALPARRLRDRGLRVLPDGAGLVSAARAAARRLGLHLRPRARGGARRHRPRRAAVLAGRPRSAGDARRVRRLLPARSRRRWQRPSRSAIAIALLALALLAARRHRVCRGASPAGPW